MMKKYDTILTKEFFDARTTKSSMDIHNELLAQGTDIHDRIIRQYRQDLGKGCQTAPSMNVVDKVHKETFNCNTIREYYKIVEEQDKQLVCLQKEVTIIPNDLTKYMGFVGIGDLHLGSKFINVERLFDEQQLIKETRNCYALPVGDICNNEASFITRQKARIQPLELPLNVQRALAIDYFTTLKDKIPAFIIGNHDIRALITETYDFGEVLAEKINGAYLGFRGDIIVKYSDTLNYRLHLTHDGKGYSYINPTHQGLTIARENHNLDVVFFGHIHDDVAYLDLPIGTKDHRALVVRCGSYQELASSYTDFKGYPARPMTTPMIILSPDRKYIRVERDIYEGVKTLRALNGE